MNVAIFGGTFDPVHRGHLAVARAAQRACKLGRIYFVPADVPPHKQGRAITPFEHRYAMLAIALRGEKTFIPSLMEARSQQQRPNYTIETVRRFRKTLGKSDQLFFILGIDMFESIGTWYKPEQLMREVEFIVVSRPGFVLPAANDGRGRIHLVGDVAESVSSTQVRVALAKGRANRDLLDEGVVEYIKKEHLYEAKGGGHTR